MKCLRCEKCNKAIRSLNSGLVQWIHNPATNQSGYCGIFHHDCSYNLDEILRTNRFTEEVFLNELDLDNLEKRWAKSIYQHRSFKDVMEQLLERFNDEL